MGAVGEDSFGVRVGRPTKGLRVWGGLDYQREEGEGRPSCSDGGCSAQDLRDILGLSQVVLDLLKSLH